jgi:anti-repressor protein
MFEENDEKEIQLRVQQELEKILNNPHNVIAAYQKALEEKENLIDLMKPKVDFFNTVTQTEDWMEMAAAVKLIGLKGWGRNKTFEYLRNQGVLRSNNEPYQKFVERGYFKIVEQVFDLPGSCDKMINRKTVVSQKGLDYIRKLIQEA